jgi:hypothetical protein
MVLFALDPGWNEFFAIGGFVVGVIGFAVTIWQIVKTKRQSLLREKPRQRHLMRIGVPSNGSLETMRHDLFPNCKMRSTRRTGSLRRLGQKTSRNFSRHCESPRVRRY